MPADSTLVLVNGKQRHGGAVIGEFVAGINKGAQGVDIVALVSVAVRQLDSSGTARPHSTAPTPSPG